MKATKSDNGVLVCEVTRKFEVGAYHFNRECLVKMCTGNMQSRKAVVSRVFDEKITVVSRDAGPDLDNGKP